MSWHQAVLSSALLALAGCSGVPGTAGDGGRQDAGAAPDRDAGDRADAQLPDGAEPAACSRDSDCNGGQAGSQIVCSNATGDCIAGCHSDADCPAGRVCDTSVASWKCVPTCATDSECNGGQAGMQTVCSSVSSHCISGCHSDSDCPAGKVCDDSLLSWLCAPSCTDDTECNGGQAGTQRVCSGASDRCITGCHTDDDCPTGKVCDTSLPSWACADRPSDPIGSSVTGSYDPAAAVAYAHAHYGDGAGLCAEFVSDCTINAGGLDIEFSKQVTVWYANLTAADVPYDEYTPYATTVRGCPGDVVIYSNDQGSNFCTSWGDEENCGHIGIVVAGGDSAETILGDFHNRAHDSLRLVDILGTTELGQDVTAYSTFRLYHLVNCGYY